MTVAATLRRAQERLGVAGVANPAGDARRLMAWATGWDAAALIARHGDPLPALAAPRFAAAVELRIMRQPVSQIIGSRLFMGLDLRVTSDVLDPRPESEVAVAAALGALDRRGWRDGRSLRLLDLGTGSGCLLLALLDAIPSATGIGVDASQAALSVAALNARRCGFADRASFVAGNWLAALDGTYDCVISNPPYIGLQDYRTLEPEVRSWEPQAALIAGEDGLDAYRRIASSLRCHLKPDAPAVFEFGVGQGDAVKAIFAAEALSIEAMTRDLDGRERAVTVSETDYGSQ